MSAGAGSRRSSSPPGPSPGRLPATAPERRRADTHLDAARRRRHKQDAVMSRDVEWGEWMRAFGRQERRVREFLGLSQDQLARLAGVSQGAVSRLEAGRGLATPLLVVMKINLVLRA